MFHNCIIFAESSLLTAVSTALPNLGFLLGRARAVGAGDIGFLLGLGLDLGSVLCLWLGRLAEGNSAKHGLIEFVLSWHHFKKSDSN